MGEYRNMEGEVALVDKDGLESACRSDPLRVQLLPCAIEADCSAKVDQFFETSVRSTRSDGAERKFQPTNYS